MAHIKCKFNSVNGNKTAVYCRSGPSKSTSSTGILIKYNCPDNGVFYVDNTDGKGNYWLLVDPGKYKLASNKKHYVYLAAAHLEYPKNIAGIAKSATTTTQTSSNSSTTESDIGTGLDDAIYEMLSKKKDWVDDVKYSSRIFALPFNFTGVTDYRPFESSKLNYGRKYLENIINESPVIYLVPGIPNFMPGINEEEKGYIDAYIKATSSGVDAGTSITNKIFNIEGRYYDFFPAYTEYIRYVNLLCRMSAHYIGLNDEKKDLVPGTTIPYTKYNWGKWSNISYKDDDSTRTFDDEKGEFTTNVEKLVSKISENLFSDYKYIKVYVDSNISISESNSNQTSESKIVSLFDTVEGLVKEVGFFTNNSGGIKELVDFTTSTANLALDGVTSVLDADSSAGLSKIIGNATHVLTGSNVVFPELWGDSSYKKQYSFTINLVSPYGDPESIYLNIIVPMMHIIALSFPRQTSANSFKSPFLVKAFSKGWFSTDLAIIDSITIEKGGDGSAWTVSGLPTEVKISISITDLYSNLMITSSSQPSLYFNNQGLIEFLAVTCGMDISQPAILTKIESVISTYMQSLFDIPDTIFGKVRDALRSAIEPILKIGGF